MSSTYGERFRLTIFGQSHAPAIGVTMEGLPAGIEVDEAKLQAFLERRAPGRSLTATSRKLLDTPARNLSGGEQRRVALLRALAVRPDYLILDELTSGLDLISQKAIREVLEAYHREYRCSYLLITHDMKFAYSLSQRIYELEHGQIIRIGQSNIDINLQERK